MKTTMIRNLLATALIGSLAACGGGGGMDAGGGPNISSPIEGVSMPDITSRTGARDGQRADADNMVWSGNGSTERTDGSITFNAASPGRQSIVVRRDVYPNGDEFDQYDTLALHVGDQNVIQGNQAAIQSSIIDIGGQEAIMAQGRQFLSPGSPGYNDLRTIVYVPRNDAQQMYAGGLVVHRENEGTHAIFGQETTQTQLSGQNGGATYTGVSMASVSMDNPAHTNNVTSNVSGFYTGSASASVDFDGRTLTLSGAMNNNDSTGTIGLTTTDGTFDANGNVTGTVVLGGTGLTGDLQGNFYGPAAQTLGATFGAQGNNNAISGQVVMNR